MGQASALSAYTTVLNDPFNNPGVPLGFGCMIETTPAMAYIRGSYTGNADGSFTIESLPFPDRLLATSASGVSTNPVYAYTASSNSAALYNTFNIGRVVAWGLRLRVLQPATAAPGILTGAVFNTAANAGIVIQPGNAAALPQSHEAYGTEVMEVLYRPTDPLDFSFGAISSGNNVALCNAVLHISGTGFPASSVVAYEIVMHLEAYSTTDASPADEAASTSSWSLANYFPSLDNMWRVARPHITNAVRSSLMDQFAGTRMVGRAGGAAARQLLLGLNNVGI